MSDDEQSSASPHDGPSPSLSSSGIQEALDRFVGEAFPAIDNLLSVLYTSGLIADPTLKTMMFNGLGLYLHTFCLHWDQGLGEVDTSHAVALSTVMRNGSVSDLVDNALRQMVDAQISGVLE